MAYPDTTNVLGEFNRDTARLATGLLSAVFCAALLFAVLVPEFRSAGRNHPGEGSQSQSYPELEAEVASPIAAVPFTPQKSEGLEADITNDQRLPGSSAKANVVNTQAFAESGPLSHVTSSPKINPPGANPDQTEWSPSLRQAPESLAKGKPANEKHRSHRWSRILDARTRLLALWHKSLLQDEQTRRWAEFSNLSRKKKTAFVARGKL